MLKYLSVRKIVNGTTVQELHLSQIFLIVVAEFKQNSTSALKQAFEILWNNGLIDSHVLIQDETSIWSLYTYLPYQNDCVALSHLKIEVFTRTNFSKSMNASIDRVYLQKLSKFNGCPLYIAPTIIGPYITLFNTSDGKYHYKGPDITVVDEISKSLNFTAIYDIALIKTGNRSSSESLDLV